MLLASTSISFLKPSASLRARSRSGIGIREISSICNRDRCRGKAKGVAMIVFTSGMSEP